jgi:hypothetical protein
VENPSPYRKLFSKYFYVKITNTIYETWASYVVYISFPKDYGVMSSQKA